MRKISAVIFEILQLFSTLNGYVPLKHLIANFATFFVVSGTALSVISCIFFRGQLVESAFFIYVLFSCRRNVHPAKTFLPIDVCNISFYIRSNAVI